MKLNRKNDLLKCATDLFGEKGYHQTSIRDICNAVGIKKATFYHYVNSKEELLYEINDNYITAAITSTQEAIASRQGYSAQEKLITLIDIYVKALRDNLPQITTFLKEMNCLGNERFEDISRKRKIIFDQFNCVITEGIENGEFANMSSEIVALFISGMINWMHIWYQPDGRLLIDQIANLATNLVLNGLLIRTQTK